MLPGGPCTQSDEDLMTIGSCVLVLGPGARGAVASLPRRSGVAVQAAPGRGAASCAAGAHTWRMINEPTPDAEATFRRQPP